MRKAILMADSESVFERVYGAGRKEQLEALVDLYPTIIGSANFEKHTDFLKETEFIFSSWGMPCLKEEQLEKMPKLKAVFYAAGSVKHFAEPLLKRGIIVVSGWQANAIPVAEFTIAQILLSCKGYFRNAGDCRATELKKGTQTFIGRGNFGETIGLIGCGAIGRTVIKLLKNFNLKVIVHDPYLSADEAVKLGVENVSLEELFKRSYVVSNHLPNIKELAGMLNKKHFSLLREDATFINTARSPQVAEKELLAELKRRPTITALLDLIEPENIPEACKMPNVQISAHIAGSLSDELYRMADFVMEDFKAFDTGKKMKYSVTSEMLAKMA